MTIIIDMDGVLVDFHSGLLKKFGLKTPYNNKRNWGKYDIRSLLKITDDQWATLDYTFWKNLRLMPDAFEIINTCKQYSKDIVLCSSPATSVGCLEGKRDWIKYYLSEYAVDRFIFGARKDLLSSEETVLIDDCDVNVDTFRGNAFLYPRLWNKDYKLANEPVPFLNAYLGRFFSRVSP